MNMLEKIELVKNLIKAANLTKSVVTIEFVKKDGTPRMMICERSEILESRVAEVPSPSVVKANATLAARHMMRVIERTVDGHQWRTVNMSTVRWISSCGQTYQF